ncbi:MAG TPA: KEOPS complex subunit Cgi121 [Methanotrichaceae archaeon]|nr:KEOPS complex subunit Cgi121 [Methanotrichaceae archaeon]
MSEICLLFGKPVIKDKIELLGRLRDLQARSGWTIQALDADKVASERHLTFACQKAMMAFVEGRNIAKDLGVEILRYASGERQIERAFSIGLSGSTERIALVIIRPDGQDADGLAKEISGLIEVDGRGCYFREDIIRAAFDISDEEVRAAGRERIQDLVIERVALVDTYR